MQLHRYTSSQAQPQFIADLRGTTINQCTHVHRRPFLVQLALRAHVCSTPLYRTCSTFDLLSLQHISNRFKITTVDMKTHTQGSLLALIYLSWILPSTIRARTPHPCYYQKDQIASDNWMPCYSSTFAKQYSCCRAGDKCLDGSACYSMGTGVTYQSVLPGTKWVYCLRGGD